MDVEDFSQAGITAVKFSAAHLNELLPLDTVTVEDANTLALCLQEMEWELIQLSDSVLSGVSCASEHSQVITEAIEIADVNCGLTFF